MKAVSTTLPVKSAMKSLDVKPGMRSTDRSVVDLHAPVRMTHDKFCVYQSGVDGVIAHKRVRTPQAQKRLFRIKKQHLIGAHAARGLSFAAFSNSCRAAELKTKRKL